MAETKQEVMAAPAQMPVATAQEQAASMLQIIKEVATSPTVNVEAMRAMMDMQRQLMQDQANRAINDALARLDLPHVTKKGRIPLPSKDGTTREVAFAKWEDIDTVIRPLLRAQGLSLSFTSEPREGGGSRMLGFLSHKDGAQKEATISLALDDGPGRNNLQAMGSTISYGKKYLAFMLLNIVTEGEDDDGHSSDVITEVQAAEINKLLKDIAADPARFLKWIGAQDVASITVRQYPKAITELKRQAKAIQDAAKKAKP